MKLCHGCSKMIQNKQCWVTEGKKTILGAQIFSKLVKLAKVPLDMYDKAQTDKSIGSDTKPLPPTSQLTAYAP